MGTRVIAGYAQAISYKCTVVIIIGHSIQKLYTFRTCIIHSKGFLHLSVCSS